MALLQISEPGLSAAPHQRRLAVGIDLGTTNSLVATVRSGQAETLADEQGRHLLPSVVHYQQQGHAVGYDARANAARDPANTISSVKRMMGRSLADIQTRYPHLRQKIAELADHDIRFLGYVNPYLCVDGPLFPVAEEAGYFATGADGKTALVDFGEFDCGVVDFTNPAAADWFAEEIIGRNMLDFGLSGWMADFGEYLPTDTFLHNGVSAEIMHNAWPALWAKCNYEALQETGKLGDILADEAAGPGIPATAEGFMVADIGQRLASGGATDCRGRVQGGQQLGIGDLRFQLRRDVAAQMLQAPQLENARRRESGLLGQPFQTGENIGMHQPVFQPVLVIGQ